MNGMNRFFIISCSVSSGHAHAPKTQGRYRWITFTQLMLQAGRLLKPFELSVKESNATGYYLVFPENKIHDPKIKSLKEWLKLETVQ